MSIRTTTTTRTAPGLLRTVALATAVAAALGTATTASAQALTWLDMAPTAIGSSVPNNSSIFLPNVGLVNITYTFTGNFLDLRGINPLFQNGTASSTSWGAHETFGAVNLGSGTILPSNWRITYTFPSLQPAGSIFLGVSGLGRTNDNGGQQSVASVNQNGTFMGDWTGTGNYGATTFIPTVGNFTMNNSVTGPGGSDPWWNTALGVVRIDDAISTLTVNLSQLPGDGVGLNIASIPTPGAAGLLALGALASTRRRRATR